MKSRKELLLGKLYETIINATLYRAVLSNDRHIHPSDAGRIEVPTGAIVLAVQGQHEYATGWHVVLYEDGLYFVDEKILKIYEASDERP